VPSAPEPQLVYGNAFEALGRVVRARHAPLLNDLRAMGLDLDNLQEAYPRPLWRATTLHVAKTLFPELAPQIADYRLGRLFMEEYVRTVTGRTLFALLKVIGPARIFSRVAASFRTANNYTEDKVTQLRPNDFELWLNEIDAPYLNQGLMQVALEVTGAKACTVDVTRHDANGTTYRCRWT
jgi:uncharacterized protein (TIGR02265 family)